MEDVNPKELLTVHLKYSSTAKSLKDLAFSELAAKALYKHGGTLPFKKLVSVCADLIKVKKISEEFILRGLLHLSDIGKAFERDGTWDLKLDTKREIARDISHAHEIVHRILKRHFPGTLEREILEKWFLEACSNFFGYYGDEWVNAITVSKGRKRNFHKPRSIEALLSQSITNNHLIDCHNLLVEGFISFLESEDNEDNQYLMLITQAIFSSRLVAADIGADPLTLDELRGSKFILDTNVLIAIALEGHKLAASIVSLEDALKFIGVQLVYLYITKEEYGRLIDARRIEIIALLNKYPVEIIENSKDDFIFTAKARQCRTIEDYERFFKALKEIPPTLPNGYGLNIADDAELVEWTRKAEADEKLKNCIREFSISVRLNHKPKKELALNHDAALFHSLELFKERGEKTWILSLDKSLHACGLFLVGPKDFSKVINLSALIEVLAVHSAGPELESANFAPLLAKMILNDCMPSSNTYLLSDLEALLSINEEATQLPPDYIKNILGKVVKARLQGKTIDNTALQLEVNRLTQQSKKEVSQELVEVRDRLKSRQEEADGERIQREGREKQLIDMFRRDFKKMALAKVITKVIGVFFLVFLIYQIGFFLLKNFFAKASPFEFINFLIALFSFLLPVLLIIPKAILRFNVEWKHASQAASKKLQDTKPK